MKSIVLAMVLVFSMGALLSACAVDYKGGIGYTKHGSCGKGARCAFSR